ncbi:MAG: SRPBCC family protein [Acidimicrobiales bacterium]
MPNVKLTRRIDAPQDAVWAVLADYPNIADWNTGIKKSFATGVATEGVGATRHCDLAPMGELEETIREWEPNSKIVISIDSASKVPIKHGLASFEISADGDATNMDLNYDYETKGGPFAGLVAKMMQPKLEQGFGGFIDDLETAAQARSRT